MENVLKMGKKKKKKKKKKKTEGKHTPGSRVGEQQWVNEKTKKRPKPVTTSSMTLNKVNRES